MLGSSSMGYLGYPGTMLLRVILQREQLFLPLTNREKCLIRQVPLFSCCQRNGQYAVMVCSPSILSIRCIHDPPYSYPILLITTGIFPARFPQGTSPNAFLVLVHVQTHDQYHYPRL
ncbi:hypothetical protein P280DRAFT_35989 [Massarina eburnea CBS 473.64]|uniref:Uncharacterized protein n=1 Tax=Massarina eburnea CBS 473.64 TaxID=1395130 RepID=A0A6A6S1W4_9PLEO|nr:hypothetical protein P280DRAFT_35989 [Massarina eburnea CBS 473.64]